MSFLTFDHGETISMLRESVRDFAAKEIAPRAAQIDAANQFPDDLWRDAKLYEIGAGTSEIRRWLIGRELFAETR